MLRPFILALVLVLVAQSPSLQAGHEGPGTHYGAGNEPEGCGGFQDDCYHMRVGLNSLDTPVIDVLLVPPVSLYPERDLRMMRQAIEMWDAGIHYLARGMGFGWLDEGVEFNIFVDDDEFTTHPAWDPEIVAVVSNPVGGVGIGIDPLGLGAPCRGANPLADFAAWERLPGFDSHHDGHGGTYIEECEGGGTTCYAVTAAVDPAPGMINYFGVYDVVSHEVGHCLSIGHVGDALDFRTKNVPSDDIMAYADRLDAKCASTLDVEGFAIRMSQFLLDEPLTSNDGRYHTQHPSDHYYASATGEAADCPRPYFDLLPGEPVSFWPEVFTVTLEGPEALKTGETGTYNASLRHATEPFTCTITAEGDPARSDQSADGCSVKLTWDDHGLWTVRVVAEDGVDEADDQLVVDVVPHGLPEPDGSIMGGITIFAETGVVAYHELAAIMTPPPTFLPGESVTLHSRGTVDSGGPPTAGPHGDLFTWHVWNRNGELVSTADCVTDPDSGIGTNNDDFDCVAAYTMPADAGRYYTTLTFEADGRWVCDNEDFTLLPHDVPTCFKAFDIALDAP